MSTTPPLLVARAKADVELLPRLANRHGLVAGATGTGKTITLRVLAEGFSRMGVPVFMADVKGDLSGIARPGADDPRVLARAEGYLASPAVAGGRDLATWPQHTTRPQLEAMLAASDDLLAMSADPKDPLCAELSRALVPAVGRLMFDEAWEPVSPVRWVGHDAVAKAIVRGG